MNLFESIQYTYERLPQQPEEVNRFLHISLRKSKHAEDALEIRMVILFEHREQLGAQSALSPFMVTEAQFDIEKYTLDDLCGRLAHHIAEGR